jgi:diketogulonate reductase-like aldo/keto reductase
VYYSLTERGAGFDLLPWQQERGVPLMAYSPIDQGRLASSSALRELAAKRGVGPAAIALAWLIGQPGVIAIPKAVREDHLRENLGALRIELDEQERGALDREFPRPTKKSPLAML